MKGRTHRNDPKILKRPRNYKREKERKINEDGKNLIFGRAWKGENPEGNLKRDSMGREEGSREEENLESKWENLGGRKIII